MTDPVDPTVTVAFDKEYGSKVVAIIPIVEEILILPENEGNSAVPVRDIRLELFA